MRRMTNWWKATQSTVVFIMVDAKTYSQSQSSHHPLILEFTGEPTHNAI